MDKNSFLVNLRQGPRQDVERVMPRIVKTVLVTGAAMRLGRAIALHLGKAGWSVAVHYNKSQAEAEETVSALHEMGVHAAALNADLSLEDDSQRLIARANQAVGPLTALVNNASVFESDTLSTMTRESWDKHIETNLRAPLVLAQNFADQLPTTAEGAIVNLLDQRLLKPTPQFLSYGVSKAGLHWLTVTLAQSLGPRIRVNAVAPGPTLRNARQSEAHFKRQQASTILGRGALPEDVAAATQYLLEARAVTGQMIAVDGGQHLAWRTPDVTGVVE
jgi:NAD(P)-dependent dehydrogenase (short-subunit alcohol dehydrogenase family)